jgi:hypothetical protein
MAAGSDQPAEQKPELHLRVTNPFEKEKAQAKRELTAVFFFISAQVRRVYEKGRIIVAVAQLSNRFIADGAHGRFTFAVSDLPRREDYVFEEV